MSITGSFILFAVFVTAYFIIIEVFTVLFRLTGLTQEKARTQVISMLTNSGFTTSESEIILSSKRRRKLAQITMLFGYSFTVIIVSVIVNIFLTLSQTEIRSMSAIVISCVLLVTALLLLLRLSVIRTRFDHLIEKLGNRLMFGKKSNTVVLIDNYKGRAMTEIFLDHVPDSLWGVRLADTQLKEEFEIQVLYIKRDGKNLEKINGETVLCKNDILFLFGNYKNIRTIFEKPRSDNQENEREK